jgi:hypothetical protein
MRLAGLSLVMRLGVCCGLWLGLALAGCKGKGEADSAPDEAARKAQQDLIGRRNQLMEARSKLQTDRDSIVEQIKDASAKGADTAELEKKKADLDSQLETSNNALISMMSSKFDELKQTGDKSAQLASREAELSSREKLVADREARIADREKSLIQRDFELSQRWKDQCTTGTPVIIQQTAPKGGNYSRKDVSDEIARARSAMQKKGLITSDLPGPAQNLEAEAGKALNDNDISRAYFAAQQLEATVIAINVNRDFIKTKIARLQAQLKASKVDDNQQLTQILGDVMQKYADGDFTSANRRLNQLAQQLNK